MNGVHDIGGIQNLGPVHYEKDEPVFHERWEARVFALTQYLRHWQKWNGYTARHQNELLPAADYFRMSYYERWYARLLPLLINSDMVTREEIASGQPAPDSTRATPPLTADQVPPFVLEAKFAGRDLAGAPARFHIGQRVRARNMHPTGHTRLPRYARGRLGTIERDHGVFPFPDAIAHLRPDKPQHVYSVRFAARELWGEQARPQDAVSIDLWEDYLEVA